MNDESCGTCKFFRRNLKDINTGFCHVAHAQVVVAQVRTPNGVQAAPIATFPNMDHKDWCGEWKGKLALL